MIFLSHDDAAGNGEDVLHAVHAVVGRDPCVVAEDIVFVNPLRYRVVSHSHDLVVRRIAVVAAHDDLRRDARLVQLDRHLEAILQDSRWASVPVDSRTEDDDGIGIEARSIPLGLVDRLDRWGGLRAHERIDAQRHTNDDEDRCKHKPCNRPRETSQAPTLSMFPSSHALDDSAWPCAFDHPAQNQRKPQKNESDPP